MSKPVKNLITENYKARFGKLEGAVVVDIRGLPSNTANKLRANLLQKKVRVTVLKNSLAKRAFKGTSIAPIDPLLEGPSAIVYGGESVVTIARTLVETVKEIPEIQFKGAVMDGQLFDAKGVEALSKYPTKGEAQAQVIQVFLGPASSAIAAITGIGNTIASLIKAVEEKLEKGEAIAKVA